MTSYNKETLQAEVDRLGPWHYCHRFPMDIVTGDSPPDMMQEKIAKLIEHGQFHRPQYPRVLDIGANSGLISMWFVDHKASKVDAIEVGQKYFPQLKLAVNVKGYDGRIFPINADIVDHVLPDSMYDLILFLGTLHHIKPEYHKVVLHKILKSLAPSGELIVQTKSELPVMNLLNETGYILPEFIMNMPDYGRSAWRAMRDPMKTWVPDYEP